MTTTSAPPTQAESPAGPSRARRGRRPLIAIGAVAALLTGYATWTNLRPLTLHTSIEIEATPDQVWNVLTDLPAYAEWNPFMVSSSGEVKKGATLRNVMRDADGDMTFTPTVLEATPGRELRWIGKVPPGGIFNGEHRFVIEPIGPGRVRLTQSERFTGVAVPLFQNKLKTKTLPQFHAMNRALAQRVATTTHP